MTQHRSFKALVRARMSRTGESYTGARAQLLGTGPEPAEAGPDRTRRAVPVLATTDERIRERTGRGWEEWFDLLDEAGMRERPHREIARWLARAEDLDPLAWKVQAVVGSYERARGGREVGQHPDGFRVTVTRTVAASDERVFAAFVEDAFRRRWLPDLGLIPRTATPPRRAHYDVVDGGGRLHVSIGATDDGRSVVVVEHARLDDAVAAAAARGAWRQRLTRLGTLLQGGAR